MGYQALLFCPDDKTSRSVTQVLSELEFTVVPCTEPFAAVKKMMAERFDAVVVDCDNEQNATLLFKSARNTAINQSSLAVAVVEGQAGVAKAFRIGANLVLTKPINVEQAKGTLRVARGLLRKNEATKTTVPKANVAKTAPIAPPAKPAPDAPTPVRDLKPVSPIASSVASPAAKSPKKVVANDKKFVTAEADEPEIDLLEVDDEPVSSTAAKPSIAAVSPASPAPAKPTVAAAMGRTPAASAATSAASAPAPARDSKSSSAAGKASGPVETTSTAVESRDQGSAITQPSASAPFPAPSFTFGGAIESGAQAGKSGSKKALVAVAAVLLIAVTGYAAWMKFKSSTTDNSRPVAVQPAKIPAPTPAVLATPAAATVAPTAANAAPASSPISTDTSEANSADASTADSADASATKETDQDLDKPSPPTQPANSVHAPPKSKPSAAAVSAKPSASTPDESRTVAKNVQPIVIKSGTAQPARTPQISDAAAPSLDGVAVGSAAPMSNLMVGDSTAPAPVLETVNVSQGVSQGLLIKRVSPVYPANALRLRVEGTVQLQATVSDKGDVTDITVLSGDKVLAAAATDAVKQWKYKPYLLNGSPVEIKTEITVKFKLPQ